MSEIRLASGGGFNCLACVIAGELGLPWRSSRCFVGLRAGFDSFGEVGWRFRARSRNTFTRLDKDIFVAWLICLGWRSRIGFSWEWDSDSMGSVLGF